MTEPRPLARLPAGLLAAALASLLLAPGATATLRGSSEYGFLSPHELNVRASLVFGEATSQDLRRDADTDGNGVVSTEEEADYAARLRHTQEDLEKGPAARVTMDGQRVVVVRLDAFEASDFEGPTNSMEDVVFQLDITFAFQRVEDTAALHTFRKEVVAEAVSGGNTSRVAVTAPPGFDVTQVSGVAALTYESGKRIIAGDLTTTPMVVVFGLASDDDDGGTPGPGLVGAAAALAVAALFGRRAARKRA